MSLQDAPAEYRYLVQQIWADHPEEWENVAAVIECEAPGWNASAWNQRGEDSRGLMQINVGPGAHTQWAGLSLFDPSVNLQIGYQLWQAQGWAPWSCARLLGIADSGPTGLGAGVTLPLVGHVSGELVTIGAGMAILLLLLRR